MVKAGSEAGKFSNLHAAFSSGNLYGKKPNSKVWPFGARGSSNYASSCRIHHD